MKEASGDALDKEAKDAKAKRKKCALQICLCIII